MAKNYRQLLSSSTLSGDEVRNREGEDLGTMKDFMIDLDRGCVAYAVLSFGGWMGVGDKLFAVPWAALTVDEDQKCFIMNARKDDLKDAPGFDKDNWPDMADETWATAVYQYYGVEPYWETTTRGKR